MPTVPALTNEQRREAYEKALLLRRQRARLKEWLSLSDRVLSPSRYRIEQAFCYDIAQGMKVYDLLTALPGIGEAKARKIMERAGIPEKNTVQRCGPKQRERLFAQL